VTDAVGFIGLGVMGSALSAHLLAAGWQVAGYDIDAGRLAAHAARGGLAATGPADAATRADVLVTSLPHTQAFGDVVQDLAAAPPGGTGSEGAGLRIRERAGAPPKLRRTYRSPRCSRR
jgi:3-hydroxyisobutyrate dehydrogenase-like beta-hydroxyacid dehydrogenase